GIMGSEMIKILLGKGYALRVWNRSAEKRHALVAEGAQGAETASQLAQECDPISRWLTDVPALEAVVLGTRGNTRAQRAANLIDDSSIAPEATQSFAQRYKPATGAQWLDAPIAGGVKGSQEGTLAIMVGGDPALTERLRPVLASYAARVTHMGPSGAGQVA